MIPARLNSTQTNMVDKYCTGSGSAILKLLQSEIWKLGKLSWIRIRIKIKWDLSWELVGEIVIIPNY